MLQIPEQSLGRSEAVPPDNPSPQSEWTALVERIKAGDKEAMERLYATFSKGVRYYLSRQLGPQEIEDKIHDTFLVVLGAIQRGELREPDRLMGFTRTIVRRLVASHIDRVVEARREHTAIDEESPVPDTRINPEGDALRRQKVQIMEEVLQSISNRDREILTRFYLYEQSQEQICQEMGLTDTQFRLLKSRAKARFAEQGKRRIETPNTSENKILRKSAGAGH